MQNKTVVTKKLLWTALVGAFCISPIISLPAAQAAPSKWSHKGKSDHGQGKHDKNDHNKIRTQYQTFTGKVSKVNSRSQFNLRVGNTTYDVYLSGNASRKLDKNDVVRVYGYRYGVNDIRNANVTLVRNR